MQPTHIQFMNVRDVQQSLRVGRKMARLVRSMAREIDRLTEENEELQAAANIYREVVRRGFESHGGQHS